MCGVYGTDTVSLPLAVPPLAVAEIFSVVAVVTVLVERVKTTVLCPGLTSTVDGIDFTALAPVVTANVTVVFASTLCCMMTRT